MELLISSDRRVVRRSVFVECQVVRERGFQILGQRAVDLSAHGMLLLSDRPAELDEPLIVAFRVPNTSRWIDTTATVVRVVRGLRRGDRGPGFGLAFAPLASEENLAVRHALERFAPIFPARPPRIDYAATSAFIALLF